MSVEEIAARLSTLLGGRGHLPMVLVGAGLALGIRVLASAVGFVSVVLLARWMGPSEYGLYCFAIAWMTVLAYPATLGLPGAAVRFLAQYSARNNWEHVAGFIKASSLLAFSSGGLLAALAIITVLFFKPALDPEYIAPTIAALAGIPIVAIAIVRSEIIRGLGWVVIAWGPLQLGQPLLLLILTGIILLMAVQLTAALVVLASIIAYAATVIAQRGVLHARLGTKLNVDPKVELGPWLGVGVSFVWISLANMTLLQAGVIILGLFLRPQDAGIYAAAAATSGLVTAPVNAATALGAPKFAELHAQQGRLEVQALFTDIIRWTFWPSLAIALTFIVFGSLVLRLFGSEFEEGYTVLLILTLGKLVSVFIGPVGSLLNMTGHQQLTARVLGMSAILGVMLGLAFTQLWGSVGTAIAFSAAIVLQNLWLAIAVVRRLEIFPSLTGRTIAH